MLACLVEKNCMSHIIKRRSRIEVFDEQKVYASSYAACLSAHIPKERAEAICEAVVDDIKQWIQDKPEVTSNQLFHEITRSLEKINGDAAFMYKTHRDVS